MANFAHSANHLPAVNLDRVDQIHLKSVDDEFSIDFMQMIVFHNLPQRAAIARWIFNNEEERDAVFNKLMEEHGSAY